MSAVQNRFKQAKAPARGRPYTAVTSVGTQS